EEEPECPFVMLSPPPFVAVQDNGRYARQRADDNHSQMGIRPMTQLLEQALTEVKKLPEPEQDAIAALILEELADERRWRETFARSQEQLACLATNVREDI